MVYELSADCVEEIAPRKRMTDLDAVETEAAAVACQYLADEVTDP